MFDARSPRHRHWSSTQPEASTATKARRERAPLARVLFVDDDLDLLAGLRGALRKEPFAIETAGSAAQALWTLSRVPIDIVVSDEQMPRVSGSELLSVVRKRFPDTVRIILTGQASLDAAIRAINGGEIYRFLTKPCTPNQIALTLREALSLTRSGSQRSQGKRDHNQALAELERSYPGITQLERSDDGSIAVEAEIHDDPDWSEALLGYESEGGPGGSADSATTPQRQAEKDGSIQGGDVQ